MDIMELDAGELDLVAGGPLPALAIVAVKAFMSGAAVAAVVLAVEDMTNAPGHNHYGK